MKNGYDIGKYWLPPPYFYLMKGVKLFLLLVFVGAMPLKSSAWGVLGHRVIGGIADLHLSAAARSEIKKLLGNESIAMASNWADFIKSDRSYDYLGPWHYINLPEGMTRSQFDSYLQRDTATDLYTRLQMIIEKLKSGKLSRENKTFYLKLLIHLVGDAHQPMHTARPEDRGGNGIKVYWFNAPTNLHRVWDEHLVEFQQLSYTEHIAAIHFAKPAQVNVWQGQRLGDWLYESYQLASSIYGDVKEGERLSYSYNYRYVNSMNQQLLKGGIRLAGILNNIFGRK